MFNVGAGPEHHGTPIDIVSMRRVDAAWDFIKGDLVEEMDRDYQVYGARL